MAKKVEKMINFDNLTGKRINIFSLKKLGKKILEQEGIKNNKTINCIFTDNKYIKRLNREYRGRNIPTDVLSFSFVEGKGNEFNIGMFGDIYISTKMAEDNAKRYEQDFEAEIKLLFIHGLLHLLGYDDENEDDKRIMRSKEKYYLNN